MDPEVSPLIGETGLRRKGHIPFVFEKRPACAGLAVRTRLELATYGVTGRYSNQLNYRTFAFGNKIAMVDTAMLNRQATCASALRFRK